MARALGYSAEPFVVTINRVITFPFPLRPVGDDIDDTLDCAAKTHGSPANRTRGPGGLFDFSRLCARATSLGQGGFHLVQQNNGGCATTSCSPSPISFPSPVTAGDVVVVAIAVYSGSVGSVGDTFGSTFTLVAEGSDSPIDVYIYYAHTFFEWIRFYFRDLLRCHTRWGLHLRSIWSYYCWGCL